MRVAPISSVSFCVSVPDGAAIFRAAVIGRRPPLFSALAVFPAAPSVSSGGGVGRVPSRASPGHLVVRLRVPKKVRASTEQRGYATFPPLGAPLCLWYLTSFPRAGSPSDRDKVYRIAGAPRLTELFVPWIASNSVCGLPFARKSIRRQSEGHWGDRGK